MGVVWLAMAACPVVHDLTPTETPPATTIPSTPPPPTNVAARLHGSFGTVVVVSWEQDAAADAQAEYSADDGATWLASPRRAVGAGPHEELLLGIPFGAEVRYRVRLSAGDAEVSSPDGEITTADPPPTLPTYTLHAADPARIDAVHAPYVFTSVGDLGGRFWVMILDRQGRPVWAYRTPNGFGSIHARVAKDGRSLYVDHNSYWTTFDGGAAGYVTNLAVDGTVLQTFPTPGLHHPFTDLPDGSVAWGAVEGGYSNEYVRLARPDGSVETLFDCGAWLVGAGIGGWCGSNTLSYDPESDRYLFSLFSIETVVELDGASGLPTRWFGHAPGSWAFDPPESAFWWQHGGYVTEAGTFLTSSDLTSDGVETIVREYAIDAAGEVLREVWSFGIGEGVYGQYSGEAVRLGGGNTWHNYGQLPRLREVTPDGDVVWDIEWDADYLGRSMPLADLYALALPRP